MRCAEMSLDEPLAGTATEAAGFVLVEHPGPWGAKALADAGLAELEEQCKAVGLRALLVRAADRAPIASRVFAAWCGDDPFLVEVATDGLPVIVEALAHGERPAGDDVGAPFWLVCTNGRRDACCAKDGLPVARALAARRPGQAWECSHLGGHRFAANVLLLPEGLCFGRVREETVDALLDTIAADELPLELLRGRTHLTPAAQAAEIAARELLGARSLDRLVIDSDGDVVTVGGVRVRMAEEELPSRPVSCDAAPEPVSAWRVVEIGEGV